MRDNIFEKYCIHDPHHHFFFSFDSRPIIPLRTFLYNAEKKGNKKESEKQRKKEKHKE